MQEHNIQLFTQDKLTLNFEITVGLNTITHRPLSQPPPPRPPIEQLNFYLPHL